MENSVKGASCIKRLRGLDNFVQAVPSKSIDIPMSLTNSKGPKVMSKRKYTRPVLHVIEPQPAQVTIFEMLDANQILTQIIADVYKLRKRLIEQEGIVLEALNFSQGFLEATRERLRQMEDGLELVQTESEIAGKPGVVRIIETESDILEQTELMTVREEVDLLEEEEAKRRKAIGDGSQN